MALDCLTESLLALTDKMSLSVKCCMVYASIKRGFAFLIKEANGSGHNNWIRY